MALQRYCLRPRCFSLKQTRALPHLRQLKRWKSDKPKEEPKEEYHVGGYHKHTDVTLFFKQTSIWKSVKKQKTKKENVCYLRTKKLGGSKSM